MTKRRAAWVGAAAVAAVFAAPVGWWLLQPPGISRAGFERIRVGMTRREVEAILGEPEGRYRGTMAGRIIEEIPPAPDSGDDGYSALWTNGYEYVFVDYRPDGTVARKRYIRMDGRHPTLIDRLKAWLGL